MDKSTSTSAIDNYRLANKATDHTQKTNRAIVQAQRRRILALETENQRLKIKFAEILKMLDDFRKK